MELRLRYYGDPVLRRRADSVTEFDDALREFADAMVETMHRERGIGLAAPQVGRSIRLLVALEMKDSDDTEAGAVALVNPEVIERSRETTDYEEGCLSIPGITADVTRPGGIRVRYQDLDGNEHTADLDGMFARILQHEIDHLNGRLFIDYLSDAKKSLLKPRLKEIAENGGPVS